MELSGHRKADLMDILWKFLYFYHINGKCIYLGQLLWMLGFILLIYSVYIYNIISLFIRLGETHFNTLLHSIFCSTRYFYSSQYCASINTLLHSILCSTQYFVTLNTLLNSIILCSIRYFAPLTTLFLHSRLCSTQYIAPFNTLLHSKRCSI